METAQEREVQLLQGRQAWPFHMMGMGMAAAATNTGCFDGYGGGGYGYGSSGGDCFVLGWEQPPAPAPFGCFGLLAADVHDLFPLLAGMETPLLAAPPPPAPAPHDAVAAIPGELDDLLLNFWDASSHDGDVGEQQDAFNSSCVTHEQTTTTTTCAAAATSTNSFFHCDYDDGDDPLSSIFCTGPTPLPAEKAVVFQQQAPAAEPLLSSSSSSDCRGGAQTQVQGAAATPSASRARTPPLPRSSTSSTPSLKRATREAGSSSDQAAVAECSGSESSKRRRTEAPASSSARVLCPFALLKPDGLDGGATLADINARILMRPSRPVRHPVGEFACAPRVSADQPGISGKAVSSFTRLHTAGRGTITIIRTRG
ncbi:uncharacterized protein LOC101776683 isoform X1 [Setaria italica]|uniref:uncharacterized protein LOC101776683 isoform X1 n=1 Tax=Setaria italica TaxID=4555 RepID=UPI000BE51C7C|nr:uncharacterized protein LOC101776683 isoform X1 [Setaria italica]